MFTIKVKNIEKKYNNKISLYEISKDFSELYNDTILLALVNNKIYELSKNIDSDQEIDFISFDEKYGRDAYILTAEFILLKIIKEIYYNNTNKFNFILKFHINNGYYYEFTDENVLNDNIIKQIISRFNEIVNSNMKISRKFVDVDEAKKLFEDNMFFDKSLLLKYCLKSSILLYNLDNFFGFFVGNLLYDSSYIKKFKIELYKNGLVMSFPKSLKNDYDYKFKPLENLYNIQNESHEFSKRLNINTVGLLNKAIANNEMDDLIILQESYQEKTIGDIAITIHKSNKHVVFIAGPSSSGKTTFSHRLSYHLKALGHNPHPIACDNFFVDREKSPKDKFGNYNFETLQSLNIPLFNETINDLLNGKEVLMPHYNFITGKTEFNGNTLKIGEKDILIIEGIHCLNNKLHSLIDDSNKFKIYISAITQLSMDGTNRISTSDLRLIRRIIRDNKTRGHNAIKTIRSWDNVRIGEENNIFPFQENADVMFNSSLIYELSILKSYVEPLLFDIPDDIKEKITANRLLEFLSYFLPVHSDAIPKYSIIREFIGDSVLDVF